MRASYAIEDIIVYGHIVTQILPATTDARIEQQ
jgi:hypothetical protein